MPTVRSRGCRTADRAGLRRVRHFRERIERAQEKRWTIPGTILKHQRAFVRMMDAERRRREGCRVSSGLPCSLLVWC